MPQQGYAARVVGACPRPGWSAVRVLAHRGNRLHAPENTRTALLSAYTAGAGALELDVQLTKDGRLVVSHDPTTERVAGSNHTIIDTDLADLRKLDVGETFRPRGAAEFHYRRPEKPGDQIETFPDLLGSCPRTCRRWWR